MYTHVQYKHRWQTLASSVRHFSLTATMSGLPCNCQPRQFRVRAQSKKGWGMFSLTSKVVQTVPAKPARPTPPGHTAITATTITVAWKRSKDNGAPITAYSLQGRARGGEWVEMYVFASVGLRSVLGVVFQLQGFRVLSRRILCSRILLYCAVCSKNITCIGVFENFIQLPKREFSNLALHFPPFTLT